MVNRGGRMEGQTEGQTDGQTDVLKFPLCSTGHRPFGAAALLSLHFFTGLLPAGHRVPLTMCDPWMICFLFLFASALYPSLRFPSTRNS